jgi:hypothetical protein
LQASRPGAFADFAAETVVDATGGAGQWQAGFTFRQIAPDNYYAFVINTQAQSWQVLKRLLGEWALLAEGTSPAIQTAAGAQNTLRVDAGGPNFTMSVNGQGIVALSDGTFAAGDVGYLVRSQQGGSVVLNADSIVVRRYDPASVPAAPTAEPVPPTDTPTPTATGQATATRTAGTPRPTAVPPLTAVAATGAAVATSVALTAQAIQTQVPVFLTQPCGLPGLPNCP